MNHFEGQAPMRLECAAWQAEPADDFWPFDLLFENGKLVYNWQPTIEAILYARHSTPVPVHAARFHNTLVQVILAVAQKIGQQKIVLSGGTFQNKYLVEKTIEILTRAGFRVYTHQQVPPNDGGIALGQIASQSIYDDLVKSIT